MIDGTKDVTGIVTVAQAEAPLAELARQIAEAHEGCEGALKEGLAHALEAGRLLAQAKRRVAHGEWQDWVRTNCPFSVRTAQSYMRVVNRFEALGEAKAQRVALLSYREALALLAEPEGPAGNTAHDDSVRAEAMKAPVPELRWFLWWVREEDKTFPLVRVLTAEQQGALDYLIEAAHAGTQAEFTRLRAVLDRPDATLREVKEVHDRALAIEQDSAEIKLRMERRMGYLLAPAAGVPPGNGRAAGGGSAGRR
jgi:hypothetical protein